MNSFFNALFIFINNPEVRDINYQIALGLLEHGHELGSLTINELAEKCFVSTSSLNRFFRIYGYKNYVNLNPWLLNKLKENDAKMITIGYYDFHKDSYALKIPQGIDEVLENMILDYYIQKITYYYAEKYL